MVDADMLLATVLLLAPITVGAWLLGYWQGGQYILRRLRRLGDP